MLDWQKNKTKRLIIRIISVILIQSFLIYDFAWAGAADVLKSKTDWSDLLKQIKQNSFSQNPASSQEPYPEKNQSPKITIPAELGSIKEAYLSKTSKLLVIHIQDDHANYEAQVNEAKLIEYLNKNYNTELVAVEGGFGDFDANFFRTFPQDKQIREKIAQYFLKKAFLSGADYLLVTADNPPTVYGAEEKSLYLEHLSKFRQNETNQASIDNYIEELQPILKSLKEQFYSKELKELDERINDFSQERITLNEYLAFLKSKADKYHLDLKDYPNLANLTQLQGLEGNIDFKQAEVEREVLIDSLTKALSKEDLSELVQKSLDFKANRLTPAEYYSYLENLTQKTWVSKSVYSNFFSYIQYVRLSEKLDNTKVFPEIERFIEALKDRLFASPAEKDIDRLSHYIKVLKGLIEIKLSPNDLEYFKEHKKELSSSNFAQLIKQYNYGAGLPKAFAFENYIDSFEDFYKIALKRDDAIVSNSLVKADNTDTKSLILVAGGFHSAGIKSILKQKDISYVVIAPCIKVTQNKDSVYFSLLKEKKLLLDDVLYEPDTLQIINSITDPEARGLLITYWVARATRFYSSQELQTQLGKLNLSDDDQRAVQLALKEVFPETKIVKEEPVNKEGQAVISEIIPTEAPAIKLNPIIQFGHTLLQGFSLFIASLKPGPKELTSIKKEETPQVIAPEQPTLLEKFTSFLAYLKPKPKPKNIEIVTQKQAPTSHEETDKLASEQGKTDLTAEEEIKPTQAVKSPTQVESKSSEELVQIGNKGDLAASGQVQESLASKVTAVAFLLMQKILSPLKVLFKNPTIFMGLMIAGLTLGIPGVSWAHYFVSPALRMLNAIPQVWTWKSPSENTLWGIAKDILEAEGKSPTNQQIVGKIQEIAAANPEITNPNIIHPGQDINIPHASPEVIAKLTGTEMPPNQPPIETPHQPQQTPPSHQPLEQPPQPGPHISPLDWLLNHPLIAIGIFIAGVIVGAGTVYLVQRYRRAAQERRVAQTLRQLQEDIQKAQTILSETKAKVTQAQDRLKDIEDQINVKQEDLGKLSDELKKLTQNTEVLKTQKTNLEQEVGNLATRKEILTKELGEGQKQLAITQAMLETLQNRLKDLEAGTVTQELQELLKLEQTTREKIEQIQKELAKLKRQKDKAAEEIERLSKEEGRLAISRDTLTQQVQALQSEITNLTSDKEQLTKELNDTQKELTTAQQTLGQISGETRGLEERKAKFAVEELPKLEQERDRLRQEIEELKTEKAELEEAIQKLKTLPAKLPEPTSVIAPPVIALPTPYAAMVFDIDNTITEITSDIAEDMLEEILHFLKDGVGIALVTAQGIEEVKGHIIERVPIKDRALLKNLVVYPAAGVQAYQFDDQGNLIGESMYDASKDTILSNKPEEVIELIRSTIDPKVHIHYRGGIITVTRIPNRAQAINKLITVFKQRNWPLVPRIAGGRSLHILVQGFDKGEAVRHFVKVQEKRFGSAIPVSQVLIIGDSFYPGGLDLDMLDALPGSYIVSVGRKPEGNALKDLQEKGIRFSEDLVRDRNQSATKKILAQVRQGKDITVVSTGQYQRHLPNLSGPLTFILGLLLVLSLNMFSPLNAQGVTGYYTPPSREAGLIIERRFADISSRNSIDKRQLSEESQRLIGLFTPEQYRNNPIALLNAIQDLQPTKDSQVINSLVWALSYQWQEKDSQYHYIPAIQEAAMQALIRIGEPVVEPLMEIFTPEQYKNDPNSLIAAIQTLREIRDPKAIEALTWAMEYSWKQGDGEYYFPDTRKEALKSLISIGEAGNASAVTKVLMKRLFFAEGYGQNAKALRDIYKDKPIIPKIGMYLLTYIANVQFIIAGVSVLIGFIWTLVKFLKSRKVRIVYRHLSNYAGEVPFRERARIRKAAVVLTLKANYDIENIFRVMAQNFPEISGMVESSRLKKIVDLVTSLNKANINAQGALEYGVTFLSKKTKTDKEFEEGLKILESVSLELKNKGFNVDSILNQGNNSIIGLSKDFAVFKALSGFVLELAKNKHNPQEPLTSIAPWAIKTAKDSKKIVARLNIILKLILEGIHPTQLLIETAQKTTSQAELSNLISQWQKILIDFKTGNLTFDPKNPLYVDLEYTTFRKLAPQVSQNNSYESYTEIIQRFQTQTTASNISTQEQAEVKIAVYEAFRLLEFIITVKQKADKLGRPVWVVPNLSYGKFAVSPILDELAKLGIEIHYAKVGSGECHDNPSFVKPSLFIEEDYKRILNERPIIIVVDGTQHLLARPQERKSARYPDAYIGYRNLAVAINEVLTSNNGKAFLDKVRITQDFLDNLRSNSNYKELVDKLSHLKGTADDSLLYALEFWNPGGLELVVREARKEVQNVSPFNPNNLAGAALIFVNSAMLDEDLPQDIKDWAKPEVPHKPAYFDDTSHIKSTVFTVNGRGVYLSHALEYEITKEVKDIKTIYRDKLPVITVQPPTPDALKTMYEAMIFDLDETLTDTLKPIDDSLLERLLLLLNSGVLIAIVTSQSLDEVRSHILDRVSQDKKSYLTNLVVYPARGAQAFNFDSGGNPISLYDRSQTDLNSDQLGKLRQIVQDVLGDLTKEVEVFDRQAQITIHLNKHKDKREDIIQNLKQAINDNNLPIDVEKAGRSTIHLLIQGINKGTAANHFMQSFFNQRIGRNINSSKVLIVGDRFRDGGSDRSMVISGARVVSVGDKDGDKLPSGIEAYSDQGWHATDRLLAEIIHKSQRTTQNLGLFSGFGLGGFIKDIFPGIHSNFDSVEKFFINAVSTVLIGSFLVLGIIASVHLFRVWRNYSKVKEAIVFMKPLERFKVFREISSQIPWLRAKKIDPHSLLKEVFISLGESTKDERLVEISDLITRLSKAKIEPRHVLKYGLPPISTKAKDNKEFISSLKLLERFVTLLNDKRFDVHILLKEIMPKLNKTTHTIEEFNEALLLGINLLKSGRDPQIALCQILSEVVTYTHNFSEYRMALYSVYRLIVEGIEPTQYLIKALMIYSPENMVDKAISDWQNLRRKFKSGGGIFDLNDKLHVDLEYTTFRELVDRTIKQTHRYSYQEYLSIIKNVNAQAAKVGLSHAERSEIKFAAYEAFRLMQFILNVNRQAKAMGRKLWVVPNLSYGRFAVSPILKDLAQVGIEIHYARIGSSESHDNPRLVKPELFGPALYDRIINEQPIIIVVDGTQHLLARPRDRKSARYPDAYVGYRNMIIAVNDIIARGKEGIFKYLVKTRGRFIMQLRENPDYRTLRRRLLRLYRPNPLQRSQLYAVEFWNPGGLELVIREARKERQSVKPVHAYNINQPTLIFVNSVLLDEDLPVFMRNWATNGRRIQHKPAYFDDTSHIQSIIFDVDTRGVRLSDRLYRRLRDEYKKIKSIYSPSLILTSKPKVATKLPYKIAIFDLDGTLADNLTPVPKPVLEKLLYLLQSGVQVAIITTQSLKEIDKYLLRTIPKVQGPLIKNLIIYPTTGGEAWGFDSNGSLISNPLYDVSKTHLSDEQNILWRRMINTVLQEYSLDKQLIDQKGNVVAYPATIIDGGAQIIIRLNERKDLRDEIVKRLSDLFAQRALPLRLKKIGGTSIRMTVRGIDKAYAVKYHLQEVAKRLGYEVKPKEILIVGNSFDIDGDDRQMMSNGARVVSVGQRPSEPNLKRGIEFYPIHGWQGSNYLLAEVINMPSVDKTKDVKLITSNITLNSLIFIPLLTNNDFFINLDPFVSYLVGCVVLFGGVIAVFWNKFKRQGEISRGKTNFAKKKEEMEAKFDIRARDINQEYPGIKIGVIGAATPTEGYASYLGEELGRRLRRYIGEKGFIFTGGVAGVGVDVYRGICEESEEKGDRFFVLLPEGISPDDEYNEASITTKNVEVVPFGQDMFERRIGIGKVADILIVLNGRYGTLHEAISALENGKKIIVLNYGGIGSLLFNAKASNTLSPLLRREGLKPEYLKNIVLADIEHIAEAIEEAQKTELDVLSTSPLKVEEVKNIFKEAIKTPSAEDIVSLVGRNATSRWYSAVRNTIKSALKRPITVYYPGSDSDIKHPLLTTDGDIFLFVDINESTRVSTLKFANSIARKIVQVGGKVINIEVVNDNEAVVRFEFQGRNRVLYYYNNTDASNEKLLPQRVKNGFDVYVEKALINGYTGSGIDKYLIPFIALRYLRKGGFMLTDYHAREQVVDSRLKTVGIEYVKEKAYSDGNRFRYLTYFSDSVKVPQIELDRFAKPLFAVDQNGNINLTRLAVYAINSLSNIYNGLTLEIDVDTLIDTSKGTPQLKGLGFKEAVASLYKAQENKEIPENLRIRLININPQLDRTKIIKALGLTEDLLKGIVNIPDIPQDYLLKGLEPYLVDGSIRVIFEDNLRYWGEKVDILVKKGQETEILSSLGLIVASLAKEPIFYQSLPQDVKAYIMAVTDEKGNVVLDDNKKIKQLIFKPIEKTKVDTEYLDKLNRANKELEGNV